MFGRLSIYDKSGVLALETKAPIGKQYLVCIDFHNRNNSQNEWIHITNQLTKDEARLVMHGSILRTGLEQRDSHHVMEQDLCPTNVTIINMRDK
jgi:hypothetical protein